MENGKVQRIVVTEPGSGYCSPPEVKVEGFPNLKLQATLGFSQNLKENGTISAVAITSAKKPKKARAVP